VVEGHDEVEVVAGQEQCLSRAEDDLVRRDE
jgi:hypothetical protein